MGPAFEGTARFQLLRPLGEGGMGAVYEVLDRERGERLALKTLKATAPDALLYLKKDFRALQDLRHPNLVRLGELFEEDGRWFFTMELVDGVDLLSWVRPGAGATLIPSGESATLTEHDGSAWRTPDAPRDLAPSARLPAARAPLDVARLREALAQLACGLQALHAAGKVHRDVKPSNVLVSTEGRVVLVDFGLSTDVASVERRAVGTSAFMAPEQVAAGAPSTAADWYSFGVLLYAVLTGALPFRGAARDRVRANERAQPVGALAPQSPADLAALCDELLALDPSRRPSGRDVLRRLGVEGVTPIPGARFVGRAAELAVLRASFADSRAGAVTTLVVGDSGLGKSMLARELLAALREEHPACAIFAGRCYERESVPYKAFDGVVDALSEFLGGLASPDVARLLPAHAALLARVFPVLRRVRALAELPSPALADPQELRTRASAALRALLGTIAAERPLVLYIDDLHWADPDSVWLLGELLEEGAAPALYVLATMRPVEGAHPLDHLPGVRRLPLAPLDPVDAQRLAAELVGGADDAQLAGMVAREAAGHPLFLVELAHHVSQKGATGLEGVRLDGALWSRVERLEPAARRLLEVLALAGSPLVAQAATLASELEPAEYANHATALRIERLVRASFAQGADRVEPYHDRVREAVLAHLSADAQRTGNLRLARALERAGVDDAAQLARHFADGGEPALALGYMVRAAEEAGAALAFEESARLYQRALVLRAQVPGVSVERDALERAAAEASSAAGHGKRASELWLSVAERAPAHARVELRRRAAEELLGHGRLDEGYVVLDTVLEELGLSMPRSKASALWRVAWSRVRVAVLGRRLRDGGPCSARELTRVDTIGGLAIALWSMEPIMGAALQADHLRLALRSGHRLRAAYAFALEASVSAIDGHPAAARTRRWLDDARRQLDEHDDLSVRLGYAVAFASVALLEGRWLEAGRSYAAVELAQARAPLGHSAVRELALVLKVMSLFWRGRAGEVLNETSRLLRAAEERGNVNSWMWLQTVRVWALSCCGRGDEARARYQLVRERLPPRGFDLQRWYLAHSRVVTLLCEGRGDEAYDVMREVRRATRFTLVGQAQRAWSTWVQAKAALARAVHVPGARDTMLGEASRLARRLDAERTPWVDAAAACVRAGLASLDGGKRETLRALEHAEQLAIAHDFEAHAASARLARASLVGGATARALRAEADAWLAAQRLSPGGAWMMMPGAWGG